MLFAKSIIFLSNRDFSDEPHALVLFLDKPFSIERKEREKLDLEIFNFDPTFAPQGKCVIKIVMESNYEYWKNLEANPENYRAEKQRVAEVIAKNLEVRFPGIGNQIEASDVVTPVTAEHWTNSYHGYPAYGAPTKYQKIINKKGLSKTLPGLENFYMVVQWAGATVGLNTVSQMGRNLIKDICKKDGKKIVTTIAA